MLKKIIKYSSDNIKLILFLAVLTYFFTTVMLYVWGFLAGLFIQIIISAKTVASVIKEETDLGHDVEYIYLHKDLFRDKYKKLRYNHMANWIFKKHIEELYKKTDTGNIIEEIKQGEKLFNLDYPYTEREVKDKWKLLLKVWHPDKVSAEKKELATKKTTDINRIKDVLLKRIKMEKAKAK